MGLLIPTAATRHLIDTLNNAFFGPNAGLQNLRSQLGLLPNQTPTDLGKKIPGRSWGRNELLTGLNLLPSDPNNPFNTGKVRRRWKHLIDQLPDSVFGSLQDALADALTKTDGTPGNFLVVRVNFDHVELEDLNQPQDPDNANLTPRVVVFDIPLPNPADGSSLGTLRHITLFTQRVPKNVN